MAGNGAVVSEGVPCTKDDNIKCLACGAVTKVGDLLELAGYVRGKKEGGIAISIFLHCECDPNNPRVQELESGQLVVLHTGNAELVQ